MTKQKNVVSWAGWWPPVALQGHTETLSLIEYSRTNTEKTFLPLSCILLDFATYKLYKHLYSFATLISKSPMWLQKF